MNMEEIIADYLEYHEVCVGEVTKFLKDEYNIDRSKPDISKKLNDLCREQRAVKQIIRKKLKKNEHAKCYYGVFREGIEIHYFNCRFRNRIIYKEFCDKCVFSKRKCEIYDIKFNQ